MSKLQAYYADVFDFHIPESHRFPKDKYRILRQMLIEHFTSDVLSLMESPAATFDEITLAHDIDYVQRVFTGALNQRQIREIGLPWSPELLQRTCHSVGGTIAATRTSLTQSFSINLGGGTHHAHKDRGQGFCIFNDVAIATKVIQKEHPYLRVMIIDCDVHQGNGTASIFQGDSTVFTYSIHAQNNFPFRKFPSDLDVPLPNQTSDREYLTTLKNTLTSAMEAFKPNLAFYLAGADPFAEDRLGKLSLSKKALYERDMFVVELCKKLGIPLTTVLAGGYAPDPKDTAEIHLNTVRALISAL